MRIVKILLYFACFVQSFASMMLPMKFDKRIDGINGGYQEYQISNPTDKTVRYKIYKKPETENLSKYGVVGSMDKWMQYYPKIITIPPKSVGIVKLGIKAPPGTKPGEYAARIGTSPISIPDINRSGSIIAPQISVPIGMEMQIFGYIGEGTPKIIGDLKTIKKGTGTFVTGTIKNEGEVGVALLASYRYKDSTGIHSSTTSLGRLMPGEETKIDSSVIKESKDHRVLELIVTQDGGNERFLEFKP
ncbi:hypothetical protein [Cetobacterium sp.]|uniref:hypothetical protein n=1 Tax=Cetobacterium sp. TaxID=2071632 RepID=UPI003F306DF2